MRRLPVELALVVSCLVGLQAGCADDGDESKDEAASCAEGYRLELPFDANQAINGIGGHGVHNVKADAHPEGHPGLDFFFATPQELKAPMDASVGDYVRADGGDCTSFASADKCMSFVICYERAAGIEPGASVSKGQTIGTTFCEGGTCMMHMGTARQLPEIEAHCPADFLDPEVVRCQLGTQVGETSPANCSSVPLRTGGTLMSIMTPYDEQATHTARYVCQDGTTLELEFPAESLLCNARTTDPEKRAKIAACTGYSDDRIW